jgi:hypothetical protein
MAQIETFQEKLQRRAEIRIEKEIEILKDAIDDAMLRIDPRIKEALKYRLPIQIKCVGFSNGEVFETSINNIFRKAPIKDGIVNDVLPSFLNEDTYEFMRKVDSISIENKE